MLPNAYNAPAPITITGPTTACAGSIIAIHATGGQDTDLGGCSSCTCPNPPSFPLSYTVPALFYENSNHQMDFEISEGGDQASITGKTRLGPSYSSVCYVRLPYDFPQVVEIRAFIPEAETAADPEGDPEATISITTTAPPYESYTISRQIYYTTTLDYWSEMVANTTRTVFLRDMDGGDASDIHCCTGLQLTGDMGVFIDPPPVDTDDDYVPDLFFSLYNIDTMLEESFLDLVRPKNPRPLDVVIGPLAQPV